MMWVHWVSEWTTLEQLRVREWEKRGRICHSWCIIIIMEFEMMWTKTITAKNTTTTIVVCVCSIHCHTLKYLMQWIMSIFKYYIVLIHLHWPSLCGCIYRWLKVDLKAYRQRPQTQINNSQYPRHWSGNKKKFNYLQTTKRENELHVFFASLVC